MSFLYVAWHYLRFHRVRTCILVACVSIILALPLALDRLLGLAEEDLVSRARSTALIVGAKGSALDLTMNAVYFGGEAAEHISMAQERAVRESDLGLAVPVYARYRARGHPVVGTSLEYFDLRGLQVARGRNLAVLGECVLGAAVARALGLAPGDTLTTSPQSVFDLGGVYPLKMSVVGVLAPTGGPDDGAVFVDVKTAWVIEGIGHGHRELGATGNDNVVLERTGASVKANARLREYTEVTAENMHTFHFHGDPSGYPLTAVIVVPKDERAGTLLRGRYLTDDASAQIVSPLEVVRELLVQVFSIKQMLDAAVALVASAAILALGLVFALSLRLREQEIRTVFRLGGSRMSMAGFVGAEVTIIVMLAGALCAGVLAVVGLYATELVRLLMLRHVG